MSSHFVYLDVPDDVFEVLLNHVGESHFGPKAKEMLFTIVRAWGEGAISLSSPSCKAPVDSRNERGFQWKQLFLPEGTMLRQSFRSVTSYAKVVGEQIICDDVPTSPSRFANVSGGGNRNAWRVIWLRFPEEPDWRLADQCRLVHRQR